MDLDKIRTRADVLARLFAVPAFILWGVSKVFIEEKLVYSLTDTVIFGVFGLFAGLSILFFALKAVTDAIAAFSNDRGDSQ